MSVRSGLPEAPWLGLGCAAFGGMCSARQARAILDTAFEAGVRYFDTARSYGFGQSEMIVGDWLREVNRQDVVVVSKVGREPKSVHPAVRFVRQRAGRLVRRLKSAGRPSVSVTTEQNRETAIPIETSRLRESVSRSLEALRTDYLDVLMLHSVGADSYSDELAQILEDLLQQGLVRAVGLATNRTDCEQLLTRGIAAQVVQFPDCAVWGRPIEWTPRTGVTVVTHSVLGRDGRVRRVVRDALRVEADLRQRWQATLGTAIDSEQGVVECLLRGALARNPTGGVLCGVSRPHQVEVLRRIIRAPLSGPLAEELQRSLAACVQ